MTWLIASSSIALAAAVLLFTLRLLRRARSSKAWPTVQGTVIDARLVDRGVSAFEPLIEYAYTVDGRCYQGRRRTVGPRLSLSDGLAKAIVKSHPKGSAVAVAIDPADPGYAVLQPGLLTEHLLQFVAVNIFTFVVCAALVVSLPQLP